MSQGRCLLPCSDRLEYFSSYMSFSTSSSCFFPPQYSQFVLRVFLNILPSPLHTGQSSFIIFIISTRVMVFYIFQFIVCNRTGVIYLPDRASMRNFFLGFLFGGLPSFTIGCSGSLTCGLKSVTWVWSLPFEDRTLRFLLGILLFLIVYI